MGESTSFQAYQPLPRLCSGCCCRADRRTEWPFSPIGATASSTMCMHPPHPDVQEPQMPALNPPRQPIVGNVDRSRP